MFGMFVYKAAVLVQVYRDNEDLRLVFPENEDGSSDWSVYLAKLSRVHYSLYTYILEYWKCWASSGTELCLLLFTTCILVMNSKYDINEWGNLSSHLNVFCTPKKKKSTDDERMEDKLKWKNIVNVSIPQLNYVVLRCKNTLTFSCFSCVFVYI